MGRIDPLPRTGWLHADGYAGFAKLYEIVGASRETLPVHGPPRIAEVGSWSHVRRGFFDEFKSSGSPIAKEALDKIGALFDIERPIAGASFDHRKSVRQCLAKPRIERLAAWFDDQLEDPRQKRSRRRHPLCSLRGHSQHERPPSNAETSRARLSGWMHSSTLMVGVRAGAPSSRYRKRVPVIELGSLTPTCSQALRCGPERNDPIAGRPKMPGRRSVRAKHNHA